MKNFLVLAGLAGILAVGAVAWWAFSFHASDRRSGLSIESISPPAHAIQPELAQPARDVVAPPQTASKRTARTFLKDYWGNRAEEVVAQLKERGLDPDVLPPIEVPWEEARPKLEQMLLVGPVEEAGLISSFLLRYEGRVDLEWMRKELNRSSATSDVQRAEIQRIVEAHNANITPLARDWIRGFNDGISRLTQAQRYAIGTYSWVPAMGGAPVDNPDGTMSHFTMRPAAYEGWGATLYVGWDDCPGLHEVYEEIKSMVDARDKEVLAYLAHD